MLPMAQVGVPLEEVWTLATDLRMRHPRIRAREASPPVKAPLILLEVQQNVGPLHSGCVIGGSPATTSL